ncbi:MAG TPA: NAD(P)-binding domain-containing protein [Bacteroidota bacterium]|nr:NAD(P)-binding domain-containing protein [Bacteroidota bacterium]
MVIIGAGPAGISMASEARSAGIDAGKILILERAAEHSFSIKKYYPDNKLVTANYKGFEAVCTGVMCLVDSSKHETISYLDRTIEANGVAARYNETVYRIDKDASAQRFTIMTDRGRYDTVVVVIAIGILGKPKKPEYRIPASLKDRVVFDVTTADIAGADVLVVGGGDSASEYCQYLVQKGNRVTLSYRRGEFSRMNDINRQSLLALEERAQVAVMRGSNIAAVSDAGGRPAVAFGEAQAEPRTFDYVVYALGGTTPRNFLKTIGIEFNGEEPEMGEAYETNVPGMFLIGDLSAGTKGGSIIWAFNSANTAMRRICRQYLPCSTAPAPAQDAAR